MNEQKKVLVKIFEIIDLEEKPEDFADVFTQLIMEETFYSLIQSLPERTREKVGKKWNANVNNHAALSSLLHHNFTQEQISKATKETASKAMQEYLQSVDDKLNEGQKEKLRKLYEELSPTTSQ